MPDWVLPILQRGGGSSMQRKQLLTEKKGVTALEGGDTAGRGRPKHIQ